MVEEASCYCIGVPLNLGTTLKVYSNVTGSDRKTTALMSLFGRYNFSRAELPFWILQKYPLMMSNYCCKQMLEKIFVILIDVYLTGGRSLNPQKELS